MAFGLYLLVITLHFICCPSRHFQYSSLVCMHCTLKSKTKNEIEIERGEREEREKRGKGEGKEEKSEVSNSFLFINFNCNFCHWPFSNWKSQTRVRVSVRYVCAGGTNDIANKTTLRKRYGINQYERNRNKQALNTWKKYICSTLNNPTAHSPQSYTRTTCTPVNVEKVGILHRRCVSKIKMRPIKGMKEKVE